MRRLALMLAMLMAAACSPAEEATPTTSVPPTTTTTTPATTTTVVPPDFGVSSSAFVEGEPIPTRFTCDGEDVSPELTIVGIPDDTSTITVIVDDPDAPLGTWTHWVEFDIPVSSASLLLPEDVDNPGVPGVNSWNLEGYMGPCPPAGEQHTYHFEIYAVSTSLGLPSGVDVHAVADALDGNVIDMVELTGTYGP